MQLPNKKIFEGYQNCKERFSFVSASIIIWFVMFFSEFWLIILDRSYCSTRV